VVVSGGGDRWWCRVVVTGGGVGWWCQVVVPAADARWWCRVPLSGGGAQAPALVLSARCPLSGLWCFEFDNENESFARTKTMIN